MGDHRYLLQGESKTKMIDGIKVGTVKYGYKESYMPMQEEKLCDAKEERVQKYWDKQKLKGIEAPDFVVWEDKFEEGASVYRTQDLGLYDWKEEFVCFLTKKNGKWEFTKDHPEFRRGEGVQTYKNLTRATFKQHYMVEQEDSYEKLYKQY